MLRATAQDAIQGALNLAADPCLFTVAGLLKDLHDAEAAAGPSTPIQPALGIGLCKVVTPLKAVLFLRANPWLAYASIAGFLGIFVAVGYRLGQRKALAKS